MLGLWNLGWTQRQAEDAEQSVGDRFCQRFLCQLVLEGSKGGAVALWLIQITISFALHCLFLQTLLKFDTSSSRCPCVLRHGIMILIYTMRWANVRDLSIGTSSTVTSSLFAGSLGSVW